MSAAASTIRRNRPVPRYVQGHDDVGELTAMRLPGWVVPGRNDRDVPNDLVAVDGDEVLVALTPSGLVERDLLKYFARCVGRLNMRSDALCVRLARRANLNLSYGRHSSHPLLSTGQLSSRCRSIGTSTVRATIWSSKPAPATI